MDLVLNIETIKGASSDNEVTIHYTQLKHYFNTTTRTVKYEQNTAFRDIRTDGERNRQCLAFQYRVKTDYVEDIQSVWQQIILKTSFGLSKGISFANPASEEVRDQELNDCKEIWITNANKIYSLGTGDPSTIQRVIVYGVFDLLGELGGLAKIWALTIGSLSSFIIQRHFEKKLKEENIEQSVTLNNIKRVSDDVDDLKTQTKQATERIN